ncbi:MAG: hypothetical protein LBS36_05665 [Oscillospiraceae bacterium]|jgi:outer membrane protein assembly factor BamB|nr:hypothetical protein [Oscillospiraceae bacterium]
MSGFFNKTVADTLVRVAALFTSVLLSLSLMMNKDLQSTDEVTYLGSNAYAGIDALTMGQGITTDGEYFYTSGAVTTFQWGILGKVDIATGEIVMRNTYAIPAELREKGSDHIGGISYYEGKIYAAIEGEPYEHNFIAIYDAETLEYTGVYYELEQENHVDGVPWVAVDAANGYFYTGEWNHAVRLNVYDLETGVFSHYLDLVGGELDRVQGCEVFDGVLFASSDDGDATLNVYAVNLATGEVSVAFTRQASRADIEAEDLTITQREDGKPVFHVLDFDKRVCVFVRHFVLP